MMKIEEQLLFLLLALACCPATGEDYVATDIILLSCGGPPESTDSDGRSWSSDIRLKFASGIDKVSTTSPAANVQKPSVPQVPYSNARIFHAEYTYSFPVTNGRKFIRLYFNSAPYNGLETSDARFSVTTGAYTLMKNFSVAQTTEALKKEFSVYVQSQVLNLTFTPASNSSYAFVNGIEVVSHPDIYSTKQRKAFIVGQSVPFLVDNSTAMENLYRINVGGNLITPSGDTGLSRSWELDSIYIFGAATGVTNQADSNVTITFPAATPSYLAPLDVYRTFRSMGPNGTVNLNYNLAWLFPVDSGFFYLVRLHFCEGFDSIKVVNKIVFNVLINNQTAEREVDPLNMGRNGVAFHKDYIVYIMPNDATPIQDLWVALHPFPDSRPVFNDAILNGLEIFKLNDSNGNLGFVNPTPVLNKKISSTFPPATSHSKNQKKGAVLIGVGISFAVILSAILVFATFLYCRKTAKGCSEMKMQAASMEETARRRRELCPQFSLAEIKAATNGFDEALLLGEGGFGRVYRGEFDGSSGRKPVAIKRGNSVSVSRQGVNEFQNEIEILSKLHHHHNLVSLIGRCEEDDEMILVYDYMENGTLREHLYNTGKPPLPWKQRLQIAIGAARGLHYLHTGAKHAVVHRDVKTTNILLDENWVAKVSDFGLSKTGPPLDDSYVITNVKGTFGYLDPEYFTWRRLTTSSDVYSFGVVLFEILCACPAVDPRSDEHLGLAGRAKICYEEGTLNQIMDPFLEGKIAPACFEIVAETAVKCVADVGTARPSMGDVLRNLEMAWQRQEAAEHTSTGNGVIEGGVEVEQKTSAGGRWREYPTASQGIGSGEME